VHAPVADGLPQGDKSGSTLLLSPPATFLSLPLLLDLRATRLEFLEDLPSRFVPGRLTQESERFVMPAGCKQLARSFTDPCRIRVTRPLLLEALPLLGRTFISLPGQLSPGSIDAPHQLDVLSDKPDGDSLLEPVGRFVGPSGNQGLLGRRYQSVDLASTSPLFLFPSFPLFFLASFPLLYFPLFPLCLNAPLLFLPPSLLREEVPLFFFPSLLLCLELPLFFFASPLLRLEPPLLFFASLLLCLEPPLFAKPCRFLLCFSTRLLRPHSLLFLLASQRFLAAFLFRTLQCKGGTTLLHKRLHAAILRGERLCFTEQFERFLMVDSCPDSRQDLLQRVLPAACLLFAAARLLFPPTGFRLLLAFLFFLFASETFCLGLGGQGTPTELRVFCGRDLLVDSSEDDRGFFRLTSRQRSLGAQNERGDFLPVPLPLLFTASSLLLLLEASFRGLALFFRFSLFFQLPERLGFRSPSRFFL
jgi:hypothetical protein